MKHMKPQNDAPRVLSWHHLGLVGGIFLDPRAALIVRITQMKTLDLPPQ